MITAGDFNAKTGSGWEDFERNKKERKEQETRKKEPRKNHL